MDYGGLYVPNGSGGWTYVPDQSEDIPAGFYSSRVSSHAAWIYSVINFCPGYDLGISNIAPAGADIQISLTTGSNRIYLVEGTTDLVTGAWITVSSNVPGNGGIVIVTDPGALAQPQRFYRVKLLQ